MRAALIAPCEDCGRVASLRLIEEDGAETYLCPDCRADRVPLRVREER